MPLMSICGIRSSPQRERGKMIWRALRAGTRIGREVTQSETRTELWSGGDRQCEADDEGVQHDSYLEHLHPFHEMISA